MGHVTIRPERMLVLRGTGLINNAWLGDQHKRSFGNFASCRRAFGVCNFVQRAAQMDRACGPALLGYPWDWPPKRIVDFENCGRMFELIKLAVVGRRQTLPRDPDKLPRRDVKQDRTSGRKILQITHAGVGFDFSAELAQMPGEGVG